MIDLAFLNQILRRPAAVVERCRTDDDVTAMVRTSLLALTVAAAVFGGVVGSWHGGGQIVFAAVKLPISVLGTLALASPVFYALTAVFGRPWPLRSVIALMLSAGARFALVLLAMTPLVWLTINFASSYEVIKLVAASVYALAGLTGLQVLLQGLGEGPGKKATIGLFVSVFLLIGAQNAWILRPYLGEPGQRNISFLTTEREGGLVVQLWKTVGKLSSGSVRGAP